MPTWLELVVLALASMFWPTLIVIVVFALHSAQPVKILFGFLAGGLLATISCGIAFTFALEGSSLFSGSTPTVGPAIDISMGLLSLLAAYALNRRAQRASPALASRDDQAETKPSRMQRVVERGALPAFAAGIVLNLVPGTFPIVALKNIAELSSGNAVKVLTIASFYVIMFTFVEVPLVAYLFSPMRTTASVNDLNVWLGRNGRRLMVYVIAGVGAYLTVRGLLQL
jgi:hypothetical protein